MTTGYDEQKKAVACGHWPLYRFDPRLKDEGKNPLQLESKTPTVAFEEYAPFHRRQIRHLVEMILVSQGAEGPLDLSHDDLFPVGIQISGKGLAGKIARETQARGNHNIVVRSPL
jgi:hypothetical protein